MTLEQLYDQASIEWHRSEKVRMQYPTFIYYWHERYERVYDFGLHFRGSIRRRMLQ